MSLIRSSSSYAVWSPGGPGHVHTSSLPIVTATSTKADDYIITDAFSELKGEVQVVSTSVSSPESQEWLHPQWLGLCPSLSSSALLLCWVHPISKSAVGYFNKDTQTLPDIHSRHHRCVVRPSCQFAQPSPCAIWRWTCDLEL
jgi:hypothetical protein